MKLQNLLLEGIAFQVQLTADAEIKYNKKPSGGTVGALQFSSQGYTTVPAGTYLVGLPGGLFAVNMEEKFAFAATAGNKRYLDAQDKLKQNQYTPSNTAPEFAKWRKYYRS